MIVGFYLLFLCVACATAAADWRRGWMYVALCGVLQDPVRKVTPGANVAISFAVVGVYAVIVFAAREEILEQLRDFARRFANLYAAMFVFILLLGVSAFNGLFTYGFDKWKVPLVSFLTYTVPMLAVLVGYVWLQREEMMYRFFQWYASLTTIALIGSLLEYLRVNSRFLGMVAFEGDYIRHLPGIQIRLLSGFYRSPDIMAWHAATLTVIGIAMALRAGITKQTLLWSAAAGWGFFNCMIAGRRKAIYYVLVFVAVFLWRYIRRVNSGQLFAMIGVGIVIALVVRTIASGEQTSVYARAAIASQDEIASRIEGGVLETFRQFGFLGAGLGTATQGVRHLLGYDLNIGWQEGGLGKLAMEVGLPGILALVAIAAILGRLLLALTRIQDVEGSSQFLRVTMFALVAANAANFIASAQAYSDAVLALTTGFFAGCLFATAALDERLPAKQTAPAPHAQQLTAPATA
ncbi:MAG TPA: hypothetical protein VJZ00_14650 [Thermoanaerobaculia bacterium]|nr:hypothetical protein [Thermoanaerobaculia bacterium]